MIPVFLDTVGLIAIWNSDDQWHLAAEPVFEQLLRDRVPMITTSFVFLEFGNAAARHPFRPDVDDLRRELLADRNLIVPTSEDEDAAWQAYRRGEAGEAGIVDHFSFVVMRRLGLTQAFTHNSHFEAAGFETLF